ncbi:hypothetical protein KEG38_06580 [Polyangium jinanense]|uniref:hypothetical protein n=1 Tax=Polyangium jinanense TaxID=2829994 RepID=UPI0023412438|nr:hypothetical protein [Polyangium jinanense]MDC3953502.1 hypothetical protein [Polyangium jinanense]
MYTNAGTLSFDLAEGLVRLGGEARLVVPASALMALWGGASPAARRVFGRALGESIGRAAAKRLAPEGADLTSAMLDASPEAALSELSAAWALAGLGALDLERWGRALVFVVGGSPLGADGDELCEIALEGALSMASGKSARVVRIERIEARARFFVSNAGATARMRAELAQGTVWAEVLAELDGPSSRGDA